MRVLCGPDRDSPLTLFFLVPCFFAHPPLPPGTNDHKYFSVFIQGQQTSELAEAPWLVPTGGGHVRLSIIFLMGRRDLGFRAGECSGPDGVYCLLGEANRVEREGMEWKTAAAGTLFPELQSKLNSPSAVRQSSVQSGVECHRSCSVSSLTFCVWRGLAKADGSPELQVLQHAGFSGLPV